MTAPENTAVGLMELEARWRLKAAARGPAGLATGVGQV
jgi:hypothetical protein